MNYHSSFNEVFLTDARIPCPWVVGQVDQGWTAAWPRSPTSGASAGASSASILRTSTPAPRPDEAAAEVRALKEVYSWYPQRAGRADLVLTMPVRGP